MSIYEYTSWDGRRISLAALLDNGFEKAEVVRLVGVEHRKHRLIAAVEALYQAGELDCLNEVLETRYDRRVVTREVKP